MANRYFNKQTTNARQALAQGGAAADPRGTGKSQKPKRKGRPSLGDDAGPRRKLGPKGGPRTGRPSTGPKGLPKKPFDNTDKTPKPKNFDNTDRTDREKITKDRIRRNKIKDRLDKLKEKMKPGLDPKSPKLKQLQEQMKKQRQADYMRKHGKKAPRRKTLSVTNSYKKEVEGLK